MKNTNHLPINKGLFCALYMSAVSSTHYDHTDLKRRMRATNAYNRDVIKAGKEPDPEIVKEVIKKHLEITEKSLLEFIEAHPL